MSTTVNTETARIMHTLRWLRHRTQQAAHTATIYEISDRLHEGRTAHVPSDQIAPTVSTWLIELGAHSSLVDDLARAIEASDWPAAYAIGEYLSVDVAVAA